MSIRTIHELPSELPHAHLYLEDIEEISKILLEAYAPYFREREKEAKIVYTVGDPRMDSIGDLETHGGTTADLSIGVDRFTRVAFRSGLDLLQKRGFIKWNFREENNVRPIARSAFRQDRSGGDPAGAASHHLDHTAGAFVSGEAGHIQGNLHHRGGDVFDH